MPPTCQIGIFPNWPTEARECPPMGIGRPDLTKAFVLNRVKEKEIGVVHAEGNAPLGQRAAGRQARAARARST